MSLLASAALALPGTDDPVNVSQTVAFGIIAAAMIFAALRVVTTRNVVHAAMWLVAVLAGASAQFILLAAEFLAVTQVMVYIGAIVVLILFGVMLTRGRLGEDPRMTRRGWAAGAVVAVGLFAVMAFSLVDTFEDAKLPEDRRATLAPEVEPGDTDAEVEAAVDEPAVGSNTAAVSDAIFGRYLLPFEIVSVLLTAALIGGIVMARRD